jgi:hypothetical protein
LMFKEMSRLVLVPSELLLGILRFLKKFKAPPRFA